MTFLIIIIYAVIVVAFAIFSAIILFHITRYSYLGDFSKRAFFYYSFCAIAIIIITLILLILNHIIS